MAEAKKQAKKATWGYRCIGVGPVPKHRATLINTPEDMQWLRDVHLPGLPEGAKAALIIGNEDCPDAICVFHTDQPRFDQPAVIYHRMAASRKRFHVCVLNDMGICVQQDTVWVEYDDGLGEQRLRDELRKVCGDLDEGEEG